MQQTYLKPRFQIYQNLLGSYDLIDKYRFSNKKFSVLKSIKVSHYIGESFNTDLNLLSCNQILTQQRPKIFKNSKFHFRNVITTLRNHSLFKYLDLLFNSIFLVDTFRFIRSSSYTFLTLIFNFNLDNLFSIYLTQLNNIINKSYKLVLGLKFIIKSKSLDSFLSYYFIPR